MTWFAFHNDGSVYDLNGIAEKELAGTGAHGYATEAEATAHPNSPASAAQASLLAAFQVDARSPVGGGVAGVIQIVNVNPQGQNTGKVSPPSPLGALKDVIGIGGVSGHNLLVRTLKIIIGGIMMLAGIIKMTGAGKEIPVIAAAATRLPGVS